MWWLIVPYFFQLVINLITTREMSFHYYNNYNIIVSFSLPLCIYIGMPPESGP